MSKDAIVDSRKEMVMACIRIIVVEEVRWMASQYILVRVLIEVTDELDLAGELREREIRDNSYVLALASRYRVT